MEVAGARVELEAAVVGAVLEVGEQREPILQIVIDHRRRRVERRSSDERCEFLVDRTAIVAFDFCREKNVENV